MDWLVKIIKLAKFESGLAYVAIGNTVSAIMGTAFWLIIVHILNAEGYGILNYYLATGAMLSAVSILGLNTTVTVYLAKGSENIRYQANMAILITNSIIAMLLMTFIGYFYISLLLVGLSFFSMTIAELLGRRLYRRYSFIVMTERALQISLSLLLYFVMGLDGVIIGYAVSALIFSYRYFKSFSNFRFEIQILRPKLRFIMHSYCLGMSQTVTLYIDKILIAPLFGFTMLGLYQLGFQFLIFLAIIPVSLYQYLLPQESSGIQRRNIRLVGLAMSLLIAPIMFFVSPIIIKEFFPNFVESISATQIMSLGIIPITVTSLLNARLLGMQKSKPVFIGALIYVSSLSAMIFSLGSIMGILGLAFSVVFALTAQAATVWIMDRVMHKKSIGKSI